MAAVDAPAAACDAASALFFDPSGRPRFLGGGTNSSESDESDEDDEDDEDDEEDEKLLLLPLVLLLVVLLLRSRLTPLSLAPLL